MKKKKRASAKKNNFFKTKFSKTAIIVKVLLIGIIALGLYYLSLPFSNSVTLLAVSEDSEGNVVDGSLITLSLKVEPGDGDIFVKLNSVGETDTQISIINSQKIACNLFDLDCENYDFHYEFDGSAVVLKGPSASSAIAILVAKTINKVHLDDSVAITGSLNSGGIIGIVGGVDAKIAVGAQKGLKKVLVPFFSDFNESEVEGVEVVKVFDIIEAYNEFSGSKYELQVDDVSNENYLNLMGKLGDNMCERALAIKGLVNESLIEENSSEDRLRNQGDTSYNSSQEAKENGNFYSQGSFCFNSNVNYRNLEILQQNLTLDEINDEIEELEFVVLNMKNEINSEEYLEKILTLNDFYVYLLMQDRIEEALDFIKQSKEEIVIETKIETPILNLNQTNNSINSSINSSLNSSNQTVKIVITETRDVERELSRNRFLLGNSHERFFTAILWEKLIVNNGKKIEFNDRTINDACTRISREISLKSELLDNYEITFFEESTREQRAFGSNNANKYLCIYKGLELNGRINTVLNLAGIEDNNLGNYTQVVMDLTEERILVNSNGEFPLIPTIYSEYSSDLAKNEDYASALLYSNFALAYTDLNIYVDEKKDPKPYALMVVEKLFENVIFIIGLLIIIAFIE